MRFTAAFVLALSLFSTIAHAEPKLLWETKGFAQPESVAVDPKSGTLYVSNIAGEVMKKDGVGFISKLAADGSLIEREWVKGLNAPTGLSLLGGKLYVADIDELVEIDVASAKVTKRYAAPPALFLNDVLADTDGTVYASDTPTNTIWRLQAGRFEPWIKNDALNGPNGLLRSGDRLISASFGKLPSGDQAQVKGGLMLIDAKDKSVKPLGDGAPIGNLDGIALLEPGAYLVTDWNEGALYRVDDSGKANRLLDVNRGSADLLYLPDKKIVLIPMMLDNSLAAYQLD